MRVRAAVVAVAAVLALAGCGEDDDPTIVGEIPQATTTADASPSPTAAPTTPVEPAFEGTEIAVTVAAGKVQTASSRVDVERGEQVRLVVTADVADEIHVHGYDLKADTVAGQPATIEFEATIPGVFEVELEDAGTKLVELAVR